MEGKTVRIYSFNKSRHKHNYAQNFDTAIFDILELTE